MKNRFDLSELYTRFIQLFEISGIEDVFDDDGDILEALRSNRSFSKP